MSRAFMIKQAPFKPTDIGGCQLWLDASDTATISLSGSTVTQINDKSGNSNNTSSSTGTVTYTAGGLNSRPAFSFNATGGFRGPISITGTTLTTFTVATLNSGVNYNGRLLGLANATQSDYQYATTGQPFFCLNGGPNISGYRNNTYMSYQINTFNTPFIGTSQFTGSSNITSINGTPGTAVADANGSFSITKYGFGCEGLSDAGVNWYGYCSEMILYNSLLSTAQRQQVEAYLAQKWGLRQQLPPGHPGTTAIVYSSQPIPTAIYWRYQNIFTPTSIGNCQLWLDAADATTITLNTTKVTQWNDKSISGYNFTQATSGNQPTYSTASQNSLNTITFTSANSTYLLGTASTTFMGTNSISVYGVFKINNNTSSSAVFSKSLYGSAAGRILYGFRESGTPATIAGGIGVASGPNAYTDIADTYTAGAWRTFGFVSDRSGWTNTTYQNGTSIGAVTISSDTTTNLTNPYQMLVGAYNNSSGGLPPQAGYFLDGAVGELLVYNTALATLQRQQVEGYLAWKWGLQANLPANHPYKNSSPSTTNPAGISRPANVLPIPPIVCTPIRTYFLVTAGLMLHVDAGNPASYPGSGSTWYDLTTSGLNVTLYGSPTYSSANGGYIAFTPSSSQYGGTSGTYNSGSALTTWTTEAWHYYTNTFVGNLSAIICSTYAGNVNFALGSPVGGAAGKNLAAAYYAGTWYYTSSSYTLPSVGWYHLVGTYDGTNLKLYVNNVLTQTQASAVTPGFGGGEIRLMRRWDTGDYWGGYIAIARVYRRALSADEVNTNYQVSKARFGLS